MAKPATGQNPHTCRIAEFVSQLSYDQIPTSVCGRLKLLILDALGCAIYGAQLQWCRILRETLQQCDKTQDASIWGTDRKLSSAHAALVNGTQVQGFELDDVHREGILHVGAVTLPALVAMAEAHAQLAGKDFITAALAGYEIGPRVGFRNISARAGTPARPSAYLLRQPRPRARWRSTREKPCTRSALPAPSPAD